MLLREFLANNQISKADVICLKHSGAKQPFCCRSVSKLTDYEMNLEVLEELPVADVKSSYIRQELLDECALYLIVAYRSNF